MSAGLEMEILGIVVGQVARAGVVADGVVDALAAAFGAHWHVTQHRTQAGEVGGQSPGGQFKGPVDAAARVIGVRDDEISQICKEFLARRDRAGDLDGRPAAAITWLEGALHQAVHAIKPADAGRVGGQAKRHIKGRCHRSDLMIAGSPHAFGSRPLTS